MPEFSFYFSYTRTNFRHIFLACLVKDVQTGCSLQIMTIMRKLYLLTLGRTKIVVPSEIVLNILIKKKEKLEYTRWMHIWQAVWQWKHQKCCETFLEKTISKNSYLKNKKSSKVSVNQGLFYTEEMAVEVRVGSMLK